ncbi:Peptidoglycan-associated lipoprotein [Dirofilaria immitis]
MCFHLFLFPFRRKVDCLVSYRGRLHGARWAKAEWIGSWRWWKREEKGRQGYNSILHTRVLLNRTLIRASGWQQEEDDEKGGWEHPDQSSIKLLLECASRRLSIVDMSSSFVLPHAILLSCAHPPTTHLSETVSTIFQSWTYYAYILATNWNSTLVDIRKEKLKVDNTVHSCHIAQRKIIIVSFCVAYSKKLRIFKWAHLHIPDSGMLNQPV